MSDPVRLGLSADAPPLAVEALELARREAPDAARLQAIEAGVLAKLGLPPGGGGGSGPSDPGPRDPGPTAPPAGSPAGAAGGAAVAKAGVATLAVAATIAAFVVVSRNHSEPPVAPAPVATHSALETAAIDASVAEPAPAAISVDDLPSASAVASAPAVPRPSGQAATAPSSGAGPDPAATERAEVALLAEAQAALAARPAESLARCDEHARRFASGTLVQEREVLAIDALMRLGRRPEAEARASRFRAAFPRSGHLRRIETLLGQ